MALAFANDLLIDHAWEGYHRAFDCWQNLCTAASFGGGEVPDPPEPPED